MDLLLQGFLIGATLTVMIGPITFTILDASLARGTGHGVIAALGMWCSDFMFITLCYFGAQPLRMTMQSNEMTQFAGTIGGCVLIGIGVIIWRSRTQKTQIPSGRKVWRISGDWLRGFVVNTFAPFSFVFWPTVTFTIVLPRASSTGHAMLFYVGVMASIMAGDTLKAMFAGWINKRISNKAHYRLRILLAILFVLAGIVVLGKVVWQTLQ